MCIEFVMNCRGDPTWRLECRNRIIRREDDIRHLTYKKLKMPRIHLTKEI